MRLYAAYNIHNKPYATFPRYRTALLNYPPSIYDMALLTYLFAFAHFSSEILIFRTARINIPVLSPVIVASAYQLFWDIA